ncbi:hypothetical protein ACSVDE_10375 [Pseudalkalibacillus sp. Hm43]|uniref:hypothetical protein n=1 Tax=Pseudalkalibacillus sp. Hm43 TaxID=3450742 RepID=UPI003F4264A0
MNDKRFLQSIIGILSVALIVLSILFYTNHKQNEEQLIKQDMTLWIVYTQELIEGLREEDQYQVEMVLSHLQAYPPEQTASMQDTGYLLIEDYRMVIREYLIGERKADTLIERLEEIFPIFVDIMENPRLLTADKLNEINDILKNKR